MADREKVDLVHQSAIHAETIRKEQRLQKLHTEFSINPFRKLHVLPDKPLCSKPREEIPVDSEFIKAFHKAREEPTKKYPAPLTESQEIGWLSTQLVPSNTRDPRFNFFRYTTDVTKHKEFAQRASN
ncbi:protein FAM183A [Mugil cephalus]|uniref:protein FAM183A n=1 Tax=Mugil cephalus TaxID=48193 RepID=UPI001FB6FD20|nr:protein FAM183A [Mugil cephalus]